MIEIANCITEGSLFKFKKILKGSEGFIQTQYGTITKLSFITSFIIMITYYFRK
jgi:hypothetical protein